MSLQNMTYNNAAIPFFGIEPKMHMRDWLKSQGIPSGQPNVEVVYQGHYEMYVQDHKERCFAAIQQRFPSWNRQGIKGEYERARNAGELQYLNIDPSRYSRIQQRPVQQPCQPRRAVNPQAQAPLFQIPGAASRAVSIVNPETRTTISVPRASVPVAVENPKTGAPVTLPPALPALVTMASWTNGSPPWPAFRPFDAVSRWVQDGSVMPSIYARWNHASPETEATNGSNTSRTSSRSSPPSRYRAPVPTRNPAASIWDSSNRAASPVGWVPAWRDPRTVRGSKEWRDYCIEVFVDCPRENGTGKLWYSEERRLPVAYHMLACREGDKEGIRDPPEVWLEDVNDEKAVAEWWERVWPGWRQEFPEWSSL